MLVVAKGHFLKVGSRLDMIWLRKCMLGASRTLKVPDWGPEGWGHLEFIIKEDVGGCKGAFPESLIKIGHDLAEKAHVGGLEDVEGS